MVGLQGARRHRGPPRTGGHAAPARLGGAEGSGLHAAAVASEKPEIRYGRKVRVIPRLADAVAQEVAAHPGISASLVYADERRPGVKPALRSVWTLKQQSPTAFGHHRVQYFHITKLAERPKGEAMWHLTTACPSRSSPPCSSDLPSRAAPVPTSASCCCSTTPASKPAPTSPCRTASG